MSKQTIEQKVAEEIAESCVYFGKQRYSKERWKKIILPIIKAACDERERQARIDELQNVERTFTTFENGYSFTKLYVYNRLETLKEKEVK